ncbi:MAG: hypothetical protein ACRDZN_16490 [Acidimicrobiales bacterium]
MNRRVCPYLWRRTGVAAFLAAALAAAACGDDTDETGTAGSADPTVSNSGPPWGPLSVVPGAGSGAEALIQGTLRMTGDCVFLDERGDDVLLVWPADRTTWTPETGTISFQRTDGQAVPLADGDEVTLAGGGSSVDEGGREAEDWVAALEWVSEPPSACVTDTRWFIGDLVEHELLSRLALRPR